MKNIFVFCPVYEPHAGGGASYFPLLASYLEEKCKVTVITESHCDRPLIEFKSENSTVARILLQRDTKKAKSRLSNLVRYTVNLVMVSLVLACVSIFFRNSILIFTRNYDLRYIFLLKLSKYLASNITLVNDLRTCLPENLAKSIVLNFFDYSFSNSMSIERQLEDFPHLKGRVHTYIPNAVRLPESRDCICPKFIEQDDEKFDAYVFFCGTLSYRKSLDVLLPVFRRLYENEGLTPIIVGRSTDFSYFDIEQSLSGVPFLYSERLSQEEIYWLEKNAALVLIPSRLEGLPRVAIETLSFHGKIVLPPCCPEFEEELDVDTLCSEKVYQLSQNRLKEEYNKYDVQIHNPEINIERYIQTILPG